MLFLPLLFKLQDKSSCYGPHTVRYLLNDTDDVIHVNIGSGATTAHLSSLLGKRSNHIWAFAQSQTEQELEHIKNLFDSLKVKSILSLVLFFCYIHIFFDYIYMYKVTYPKVWSDNFHFLKFYKAI